MPYDIYACMVFTSKTARKSNNIATSRTKNANSEVLFPCCITTVYSDREVTLKISIH